MLSAFRIRKLRARFKTIDMDGNGVIELNDYLLARDNIARLGGFGESSGQHQQLTQMMHGMWESLRKDADTDRDDKVTLDEYLSCMAQRLSNRDYFKDHLIPFTEFNFRILDPAGTGALTRDQFVTGAECMGMAKQLAASVFDRIDVDGQGRIDKSDFNDRIKEFYFGEDPEAPGNWLFGDF
jgi:Ca2+-binding EF-hand superfamily protein